MDEKVSILSIEDMEEMVSWRSSSQEEIEKMLVEDGGEKGG